MSPNRKFRRDQRASSFLPSDLPNPPIYSKVIPADAPILTLALTSKTLPPLQSEDLADTGWRKKFPALWRRAGQHQRRSKTGGAHPGQSD
jgi:hypothetical protein